MGAETVPRGSGRGLDEVLAAPQREGAAHPRAQAEGGGGAGVPVDGAGVEAAREVVSRRRRGGGGRRRRPAQVLQGEVRGQEAAVGLQLQRQALPEGLQAEALPAAGSAQAARQHQGLAGGGALGAAQPQQPQQRGQHGRRRTGAGPHCGAAARRLRAVAEAERAVRGGALAARGSLPAEGRPRVRDHCGGGGDFSMAGFSGGVCRRVPLCGSPLLAVPFPFGSPNFGRSLLRKPRDGLACTSTLAGGGGDGTKAACEPPTLRRDPNASAERGECGSPVAAAALYGVCPGRPHPRRGPAAPHRAAPRPGP